MLSRLFVYPTPHSHRQHDRRLVHRTRHRHEHPLMFHVDMGLRRYPKGVSTNMVTQGSMYSRVMTEMLELHNYHRARHCAKPLTISQRLNEIAQSYADYLAATSKFEHSGNKLGDEPLGENLYMQWISQGRVDVSTKAAIRSWYDEIALHNFQRPKFSKETGHFTQMVWRASRKLGVGVAISPNGQEVYFVTNYYPAGNIIGPGTFEQNVLPAQC